MNRDLPQRFAPFETKMLAAGLSPAAVRAFRRQYGRLLDGETGFIPDALAAPVDALPALEALEAHRAAGVDQLDRVVQIKLNGGLGTSMGLSGPKSLIPVRGELSFLDIVVRQVLALRRSTGARLPLLLMNSFNTRQQSLDALARYPDLAVDLPLDFLQGQVPKVRVRDLAPAEWPEAPEREWCPPGHGDLYGALAGSGMLDALLASGYELAFVSNVDNLGATLDPAILGYMAGGELPFLMEVAERSPADRKGGHLARRPDDRLILREVAQCPPDELESFQDIRRYRYFNTNNLWIHLPSLARVLDAGEGSLDLPLIRNEKPVDPTRPESPRVYQLETAMGSAIAVFDGAGAIQVPRERFRPVKQTGDLLGLRSDAYRLAADGCLELRPERGGQAPEIDLDPRYYARIDDLALRFPAGPPSLLACQRLEVRGDLRFGGGVQLVGSLHLEAPDGEPRWIDDGACISGPETPARIRT